MRLQIEVTDFGENRIDQIMEDDKYVTLFRWRHQMKIYAKGCDAPGCTQEAEMDKDLGRPVGWYFLSLDGGNIPTGLRRTSIVCPKCVESMSAIAILLPPSRPPAPAP